MALIETTETIPGQSGGSTKTAKTDRGSQSRDKLIEAGVKCLAKHGFGGANVSRISRMAGLSRGPLQYHFPEKNDLFVAIAERLQDNNLRSLIPELKTLPMDEAKVDALLNRLFSIVGTDDQLARMEIQIAMRTDADLRDAVEAIDDQTANQYRAALPEMFPGMNEKTANDIVVFLTTVIRGLSMRPPSKEDKAALPFIQQSVRVAILNSLPRAK